jgi:hypothetical protein
MKLRLHAGSLRLRLSQSEVTRLQEAGKVEDRVAFSPGNALVYSIETGEALVADLHNGEIRIVLPRPAAAQWMESDQTGIEASTGTLKLLVEKDFQCLHRPPEEDAFPNPLAS